MPVKGAIGIAAILLASGCSDAAPEAKSSPTDKSSPVAQAEPETIKTTSGATYVVERVAGFKAVNLPQNSDLKMSDGDLAKYAVSNCSLDAPVKYAASQCDVYVQADNSGTLIGYAFVYKVPKGVSFSTVTTLNPQKEPGGGNCYLNGDIYDEKSDYQKLMVSDPSRDFQGRNMYYTFKNGAGDTLVSPVDPNDDAALPDDAALGVWYIKKEGDKLRIEQERWNYCYKSSAVTVDDVFYRAVSLVRKKWVVAGNPSTL